MCRHFSSAKIMKTLMSAGEQHQLSFLVAILFFCLFLSSQFNKVTKCRRASRGLISVGPDFFFFDTLPTFTPRGAAAKARSMRESGPGMDHHHHPEMSGGGGAAERDNMTDVEIIICRGM